MSIIPDLTALTVEDVQDMKIIDIRQLSTLTGGPSKGRPINATLTVTHEGTATSFQIDPTKHLTYEGRQRLVGQLPNLAAQAGIAPDADLLTANASKSTVTGQETVHSAKSHGGYSRLLDTVYDQVESAGGRKSVDWDAVYLELSEEMKGDFARYLKEYPRLSEDKSKIVRDLYEEAEVRRAKKMAGSTVSASVSGPVTNRSLPGKTDLPGANNQASSQQPDSTDKSTEGGFFHGHVELFDETSPVVMTPALPQEPNVSQATQDGPTTKSEDQL